MKVPIAWLRDYLDFDLSSDEIAERFATLGFPVEDIVRRPRLSGVKIGRLARVEKHPDADRLQVCTVDIGASQTLTIATAATNVATGQVVPVAVIGAELVGLTIAPRKMRGIASEGMLCSAGELGLDDAWFEDGIVQLESSLPLGADFVATFGLRDDVLDVEITANRVDAMSIVGLARELSASLQIPLKAPALAVRDATHDDASPVPIPSGTSPLVTIASPDCKRFVGQRFSSVVVSPAPFWMRVRLALAGQRPINNLVDVSNFVMLETAQPLHMYDVAHLAGGRLVARDARDGEAIRTLDEADRALDARFLVIADDAEPQGIAGLKGGATSEVTPATSEILVEAATFSGPRVRRMSVALGLRTEASTRHEKGLPLGLADWASQRAAHLLASFGATAHAAFAVGASPAAPEPIVVPLARARALLGMPVTADEATSALTHLGFAIATSRDDREANDGVTLHVTPPFWRGDVRIAEDVVEEIARIVGYDRLEAVMPPIYDQAVPSRAYHAERRVAHGLAALGYREAITLSVQPATVAQTYARANVSLPGDVLEITNPLSEDQRYLRFSLVPALISLAAKYRGDGTYRAFEIGHVFASGEDVAETAGVAWLLALPPAEEAAWRDDGFVRFKGESTAFVRGLCGSVPETARATLAGWHPGKTGSLRIDGRDVAIVGAVDPRLLAAMGVDARVYAGWMRFADLPSRRVPAYRAPSRFPAVARDLALVVAPDVPAIDIERAIRDHDGAVAGVHVFDEYRGPQVADGRKSIAVRVTFQRPDATLTDADADAQVAAILERLRDRCGATIRA
ncbi:MAG: phenylalanine--tRNA ligase subunit beta [Vulcanimicrobiaceae bacterium]